MRVRSLLRYFLSGLLMGGADIIPGVSGGTIALIVGVYERLVGAVSSLVSLGLALVRFRFDEAREHTAQVPWSLLLPLGAGIVCAGIVGARIIPGLIEAYPHQMNGLFLGLVAASLLIPVQRMRSFTARHAIVATAFAIATFFLVGLPVFGAESPSLLRVFASSSVAICAMILPGISGAYLLKALGIYEPTLTALNGVVGLDLSYAPYVLTFCAGATLGLGAFAKVLEWLLEHRHDVTMAALLGLIAGALRALWPYGATERVLRLPEPGEPIVPVVALAAIGFVAVMGLIWWGRRLSEPTAAESAST